MNGGTGWLSWAETELETEEQKVLLEFIRMELDWQAAQPHMIYTFRFRCAFATALDRPRLGRRVRRQEGQVLCADGIRACHG